MPRVAIVGASNDRRKFGNKAVRAFRHAGWDVYPVNPSAESIEGLKAYPSLDDLPESVDRVSMYVPPEIGVTLLETIRRQDPDELFLNPGAESPELLDKAAELGINAKTECSIVNIGLDPDMFPA